MTTQGNDFVVELTPQSTHLTRAVVKIPPSVIKGLYTHAAHAHRHHVAAHGFHQGGAPIGYIAQNFNQEITKHVKEFLVKYLVISHLYRELRIRKLVMAGEPRLIDSHASLDNGAQFHFDVTLVNQPLVREWRYVNFKPPRRKNYKDIDKQATEFIKEEETNETNFKVRTVGNGDWVHFSIALVDDNEKPILGGLNEELWLKIGAEETSLPFQELFANKKVGDKFCSRNLCLQDYFNTHAETQYLFLIEILDVVHQAFFSLEAFKKHFKLKTNKKAHQKLVEVFSFRNDLSLRRAVIEDAFDLLLSMHEVATPVSSILRQQQVILDALQGNPDYLVYKTQQGFHDKIKQLAHKQIQETIFMEMIAYNESLAVDDTDVHNYLNLTQRPRTKDFIYFQHPAILANSDEYPILAEPLKQVCLREKALNHILHHLTA